MGGGGVYSCWGNHDVTRCACCLMQERLFDQSDAYRVHVCEKCGLIAVANLKKGQLYCLNCKRTTGIVQVLVSHWCTAHVLHLHLASHLL